MNLRLIIEVALVGLRRLWHGKLELLLTFVVPVAFFTIFAMIFTGGVGSGRTAKIKTVLTDLDRTPLSQDFVQRLTDSEAIGVVEDIRDDGINALDATRDAVVRGQATVAIVVPEGWGDSLRTAEPTKLFLLADSSDQIGPKVMKALVQETLGKALAGTPRADLPAPPAAPAKQANASVEVIDLFTGGKTNPAVSMYAAGIAVMFLLFSATGAAGSLLEEEENQTLERLLASRVGMTHVLLGKWLQLGLVGVCQVVVMFTWAQLAFGLDVARRWDGFLLLTLVTAGAAAALALALAAACRTRAQLNAVSVVLVLTMSALGGSMVPRYIMSDTMQQLGRATFNAWAIDGYTKLFWRDLPTAELWPEVAVMVGSAALLLIAARVLAMRWETA
ncbi:ABC transporter permease [Botrimarina hoheduenensis]|uniref:ABC-2 family transporter protein n=1 Tax=Botrimarina hoheduenensis TaxID=2528000 RepID=A0A5C5VX00_9BACT|nr:ABC transporter permease [Botrimarina hoheduenensis]TWT43148.1 ABC-2 family transporter protein [Botrimarina hoheduenensis]